MIVIVTGGRHYAGTGLVEALDDLQARHPGFMIFVGDATGADEVTRDWADARGRGMAGADKRIWVCPAQWDRYGKRAGPIRHRLMVSLAESWSRHLDLPAICLAAAGGRGTAHCVRLCREAGFEVREVMP